ncbi:MAG: T9SS type A sorting domain-containing protein [Candidatus Kapabacteria bacterium]|nr:T9SS type A sorting domain-containing protein [Candidatus Kapabacteria bacterium]
MRRMFYSICLVLCIVCSARPLTAETFDRLVLPAGVGTITCLSTEGSSVFVGTTAGVAVYDVDSQEWIIGKKPINTASIVAITASSVECMAVTNDGSLMFSNNRGLDWYEVQGGQFFSFATTVAFHNNQFVVGATNGLFTVNPAQQQITQVCANELNGSIVNIALFDNQMLVVQDGQKGRAVIYNDGKSCTDVTESSTEQISSVQGGFHNGIPILLGTRKLFEWNDTKREWSPLIDLGTLVPAVFLNIHPTDPIAVVGHGEFVQLIDITARILIGPALLADLNRPGEIIRPGGFVDGRWAGVTDLGPIITGATARDIIEENRRLNQEFFIELTDDVPTLLANVPYRMYEVSCNARRLIATGTVGADGRIRTSLAQLETDSTSLVEFEVVIKTETTDKVDRPAGFDTLYVQTIRNRLLAPDGSFLLPQLRDIQNRRVTLGHTMMGFRFVVAVEWDANTEYVDVLKSWMVQTNDMLLDVTDGQAYIERAIICDSRQAWGAKDIAFETSNTVWPHVNQAGGFFFGRPTQWINYAAYMPRAHFGDRVPNRELSADPAWLTMVGTRTVTVLVHELGHHVFGWLDEYVSWLAWNNGPLVAAPTAGRCFGLMHYNYLDGSSDQTRRMVSELSSDNTAWSTGGGDFYSATLQYSTIRKPCWEHYRDSYSRAETFGGTRVRSRILRPIDRVRATGDSIILGPRDIATMQTTCLYQQPVQLIDATVISTARTGMLNVNNGGLGVPDISVDLLQNTTTRTKLNYQGHTSSSGTMQVLGILPGNVIKVFGRSGFDRVTSTIATVNNGEIVVPVAGFAKDGDRTQQEIALTIAVEPAEVSSRNLFFVSNVNGSSASIKVSDGVSVLDTYTGTQDGDALEMMVPINTSKGQTQLPIRVALISSAAADNILSHSGSAQFFKEPDGKLGGSSVAIASGFLPPPFNGIGADEELLSDLISIGGDGSLAAIRSFQARTWHEAPNGRFAVMHKWNTTTQLWDPLVSYENDDGSVVSAVFDGTGTYAVFSRPEAVLTVNETENSGVRLFPNPATSSVTINVDRPATAVEIHDMAGSRLKSAQHLGEGSWTADVTGLASGLYFVRIVQGGRSVWQPLIVQK